jgi:hypothetical protein
MTAPASLDARALMELARKAAREALSTEMRSWFTPGAWFGVDERGEHGWSADSSMVGDVLYCRLTLENTVSPEALAAALLAETQPEVTK